jgi:hypothetical protein
LAKKFLQAPLLTVGLIVTKHVALTPMLVITGNFLVMAPLSLTIMTSEFAAAIAFGVVMDLVKIPVFTRLRVS